MTSIDDSEAQELKAQIKAGQVNQSKYLSIQIGLLLLAELVLAVYKVAKALSSLEKKIV